MPLSPGTCLGPFEILDRLGAGGMGEVYRARDSKLGREVAIKVMRPSRTGVYGVFVQDFIPGRDTSSSLRRLAGFDPENPTESFCMSQDESRIILAVGGPAITLMLAKGLPDIEPPRRQPR